MIRKKKRLVFLLLLLPIFAIAASLLRYDVFVIAQSALNVSRQEEQVLPTTAVIGTSLATTQLSTVTVAPPFSSIYLQDDRRSYFVSLRNKSCLQLGVHVNRTLAISGLPRCDCKEGWYGEACSIPSIVQFSDYKQEVIPQLRVGEQLPRRIINAFPFNIEFELLEARFLEIGDVVDVFLILESNFTAYGERKPLRLLNALQQGKYAPYAHKIVHVLLDYFPNEAYKNGWIIDNLLRDYIVTQGLLKQVSGYRDDDIFLLNDADELPRKELLLFLKLHDGYPQPVGFHMHWTLYGFFWGVPSDYSHICAVSIAFLRDLLQWGGIRIRSSENYIASHLELGKALFKFTKESGSPFGLWKAGRFRGEQAGWHCSWCCSAECILVKLVSAQNGDFPRWGDFPAKRNITYIRHLVKEGLWFDDKSVHKPRTVNDHLYAPLGVLQNVNNFSHILTNPYQ